MLQIQEPGTVRRGHALFALGFRPFFSMAGLFAVVLMLIWIAAYGGGPEIGGYYGSVGWHSHEMLFGYAAAVIAGFLLTAVRNWTGTQTLFGGPLAALAGLWLAGRLAPLFAPGVPGWLIAVVDSAFLPLLAAALAVPLLRAGQRQNYLFVPLLLVLTLANVLVHLQALGLTSATARQGTYLAVDLVVLLIVIMGGRVIPFFTERALTGIKARRWRMNEWLAHIAVAALLVADVLFPHPVVLAVLAAVAAVSNGLRLAGWYSVRIWRVPLLWVLHLGYGWLVVGFALKALAAAVPAVALPAVHALTTGGIGVVTLGMMARVALGHTGRAVEAASPVVLAFGLINIAAVLRVLAPIVFPQWYAALIGASGGVWALAFAIFGWVYVPILLRSRIDGRPG